VLKKISEIFAAVDLITNPNGVEKVGFSSRPFVITTFPAKRVKGASWIRKNGNASLTVSVPEGQTVPFGMDRLIPIFLATMAVKTRSRTITFDSASDVLDLFGLTSGGINYKRLSQSIERVFNASVFFKIESKDYRQQARFHFISSLSLWKNESPNQQRLEGLPKNQITLSQEFFEEIQKHPIPVDLEVVKILRNKPLALDVYLFVAYKAAAIKHTTRIPLSELFEAFGSQQKELRQQRLKMKKILQTITTLARVHATVHGDFLVVEPSKKKIRSS
jgi:hypothetical protein